MLHRNEQTIMKTIERDEVFQNLKGFLKTKGIELQEGSYTRGIQHGCGILADTVNLSQRALARAKTEMGKRLKQVRQVIHEKTGPPPLNRTASPRQRVNPNRTPGRRRTVKAVHARARGSGAK
jgi:hypothetical protein